MEGNRKGSKMSMLYIDFLLVLWGVLQGLLLLKKNFVLR